MIRQVVIADFTLEIPDPLPDMPRNVARALRRRHTPEPKAAWQELRRELRAKGCTVAQAEWVISQYLHHTAEKARERRALTHA